MHDSLYESSYPCTYPSKHPSIYLFFPFLSTIWLSLRESLTQSGLTSYIGVWVDKVFGPIRLEDTGLDEAQQGVKLLQVVLDWSPRQQNSEINWELRGKRTTCSNTKESENREKPTERKENTSLLLRSCAEESSDPSVCEPRPPPAPSNSTLATEG